jgi:hypothetical protein
MLKLHNASLSAFNAPVKKMIPDWEVAGKSYWYAIVIGMWYVVDGRWGKAPAHIPPTTYGLVGKSLPSTYHLLPTTYG